jgi:hypothetical protein
MGNLLRLHGMERRLSYLPFQKAEVEDTSKVPTVSHKPIGVNLCKVHGVPLTVNGKCLMKGCKYS